MKKMIFLKVKNSYNKKLVTWLDLNLQVAQYCIILIIRQKTLDNNIFICYTFEINVLF